MYLEAKELIFHSILFQLSMTRISHQDDINTWVDKRMLLDMVTTGNSAQENFW